MVGFVVPVAQKVAFVHQFKLLERTGWLSQFCFEGLSHDCSLNPEKPAGNKRLEILGGIQIRSGSHQDAHLPRKWPQPAELRARTTGRAGGLGGSQGEEMNSLTAHSRRKSVSPKTTPST